MVNNRKLDQFEQRFPVVKRDTILIMILLQLQKKSNASGNIQLIFNVAILSNESLYSECHHSYKLHG